MRQVLKIGPLHSLVWMEDYHQTTLMHQRTTSDGNREESDRDAADGSEEDRAAVAGEAESEWRASPP